MSDNRAEMMERLMEMETTLPFPWGAVARAAHDEIARLQTVLDAARKAQSSWFFKRAALDDAMLALGDAVRALDGEVKPCPTCDGSGLDESGERQCRRCNGRGR